MLSNFVIGLVRASFAVERKLGTGIRVAGEAMVVAGAFLEEDADKRTAALNVEVEACKNEEVK